MKLFIVSVAFFLSAVFGQETSEDHSKFEEKLKADLYGKYNKNVHPPHNSSQPVVVSLGFSLIFIEKLDPSKQSMTLHGWMKYAWVDSRLKWDSAQYGGLGVIRTDKSFLWLPDITLYNSVDLGDLEYVTSFKTKHALVYPNGDVIWIPAITLKSICEVDLTYYPFDTHNCSLKFGSWVYDNHKLDIKAYEDNLHMDLSDTWNNTEWSIVSTSGLRTEKKYSCCPELYPDLTFSLELKRASLYHSSILFPVSAGVILALITFLFSPYNNLRLHISLFSLFLFVCTIFYMFILFPSTGHRTPCVVLISQAMIILTTLGIVWNALVRLLTTRFSCTQPSSGITKLLNTWPIKNIHVSASHIAFTMKERAKDDADKDQDAEAILKDEKLSLSTRVSWVRFFIFLDRVAFVTFIIILISLLFALSH